MTSSKDRIFPRLVGAEMNSNLLEQRPHILIEDLAIDFYIDFGSCDDGLMSIPIHNRLSEMWGMNAAALYEIAVSNLTNANVGTFRSMKGI